MINENLFKALSELANAIETIAYSMPENDDKNCVYGHLQEHRSYIAQLRSAMQPNNDAEPQLNKPGVSRRFDDERYEAELDAYLKDGIDYGIKTISKADQGDIEQLASDSFWYGYKAAAERFQNGG